MAVLRFSLPRSSIVIYKCLARGSNLGAGVRSQRLKTMSMCVRLISVYRVYLILYRAACWNVVLFNLFNIACQ